MLHIFHTQQPMRTILQTFLLSISIMLAGKVSDAQKRWSVVGTRGFSTTLFSASIAVDSGGTPYVAFVDTANNNEVTVKKYDGTNWVPVGSTGFYTDKYSPAWTVIDDKGTPYVTYPDFYNNYHLVVIKYDGSSWTQVGSTGLSVGLGTTWNNPLAAGKNGIIYVAGSAFNKAAVVKYDGTSWSPVGIGLSKNAISHATIDVDSKNNPCIAFQEDSTLPNGVHMGVTIVKKYDGSAWKTLGGNGYKLLNALTPIVNFDRNDTSYVVYEDLNGPGNKASMLKFYDTSVTIVGNLRFSPFLGFLASTIDNNDVPYIVNSDYGKNHGMTFDGTSWISIGDFFDPSLILLRPSIATDKNGTLYVSFVEGQSMKITVVKYDYCPLLPKVNLCAVFNDTITYNNIITWENKVALNLDSYKIYRENNGKYELIGAVGANQHEYKDTNLSPFTSSYRYKLAVLDSCGIETVLDSVSHHSSILLKFNYLLDNKTSITWSKYEGIANPVYRVMRSNNSNSFVQITSLTMQGNDTTYIDRDPPSGNNVYRIDITLANTCNLYNKITSNIVSAWHTGIEEHTEKNAILIAPNPAQTELTVNASHIIKHVSVYTITGRVVKSKELTGFSKEVRLEISDLPTGTYLLKVNNADRSIFVKQ